jgi:glutathione synthase/RimK-type ligase-like ATP-grasp enzyme
MARIKVWPYKVGSQAARALAGGLRDRLDRPDIKVLRDLENSSYRPHSGDTIINFGNSQWDNRFNLPGLKWINHPSIVSDYSNKLSFYRKTYLVNIQDEYIIPYTTNNGQVIIWLDQGHKVVARYKLTGHSGEGIVIINPGDINTFQQAPVYTKYMKKRHEYRIHFFRQNGYINVQWQQKKKRDGYENPNWEVRNYNNGFIYATQSMELPSEEKQTEIHGVINKLCQDLDYGAVDLLYTNDQNGEDSHQYKILEVNTAMGIQSPTILNFYLDNFERRLRV